MDTPHNHLGLKVKSVHEPHAAHVTITVLVNCEREPQYFPSLDVVKSASAASTWWGKKGHVVDGDGLYNTKLTPTMAAKKVLP